MGATDKVLVTGAAGFIGAHLTRDLLARGAEVVALDDLSGGYAENLPQGATFVRGSVTDTDAVNALFAEHRFRHVYHLAAYAAEGLSHFIRGYNYTNNLLGSTALINAAVNHGAESFVFASSIAVYGAGQVPMREDMTPAPEDPYGIAKYAVELDLKSAHEMFGLNCVIFRPHNVYGEYQNIGDRYRNVIGIFMNQILQGRPMTIFGDGTQERAFTYVGDIIAPMVTAAWHSPAWGRVFNVGADTACSVNALAEAVAGVMGVPGHPVEHLPARNEVTVAYSEHAACRQVFPDQPNTALRDGLTRMAEWAKVVGARETPEFAGIEIRKNLPASWA